jgi:bifunctional non-homologous end joining protein LigD
VRWSVSPDKVETEIDGRRLTLSNLDKVLYPESGFTKGQVIDYYARIAEVMLPHIVDRPATFKRYPDGVDEKFFFEKHAPSHTPEWVHTVEVPSTTKPIEFAVICDRPSLLWAANLAALEIHVPLWRAGRARSLPAPPDHMVFDLDPGPGTTIVECCRVARLLADRLGEDTVFPKTSGSKGMQVYMPFRRRVTSEKAGQDAHDLALAMEKDHPGEVVSRQNKDLRHDKVLIDWSQNNPNKTTVAAYSLRARAEPTVSTPVTWAEVDACAKSGNPLDLRFEASDVLARVEKTGDLMAPLLTARGTPGKKAR